MGVQGFGFGRFGPKMIGHQERLLGSIGSTGGWEADDLEPREDAGPTGVHPLLVFI